MVGFWDGSGISWTICKQFSPQQHLITQFLQAGCSSWRQPTVSKHWRQVPYLTKKKQQIIR